MTKCGRYRYGQLSAEARGVSTATLQLGVRQQNLWVGIDVLFSGSMAEALGDFRPGTISVNFRKCGKKRCACAQRDIPDTAPVSVEQDPRRSQPGPNLRLGACRAPSAGARSRSSFSRCPRVPRRDASSCPCCSGQSRHHQPRGVGLIEAGCAPAEEPTPSVT